jgi:signal transduction histidine kinase
LLSLEQIFFKKLVVPILATILVVFFSLFLFIDKFETSTILAITLSMFIILTMFASTILHIVKVLSTQMENTSRKLNGESDLSDITIKEFDSFYNSVSQQIKRQKKKYKKKQKQMQYLEQANLQKEDIIAAISHEFKNPLSVINGYVETILDDEDISHNVLKKFLNKISKNTQKMILLMDRLRLVANLDNDNVDLNPTNVAIPKLVSDSIEFVKEKYNNRNILVKGTTDRTIYVDEILFQRAIANLVDNALKYSESDVIITLSSKSIDISDKGIGISSGDIKHIKQKFYRVNQNSWNNSLGMGLHIVNTIVKLHHFSLEAKSEPNNGSTFSIVFKEEK